MGVEIHVWDLKPCAYLQSGLATSKPIQKSGNKFLKSLNPFFNAAAVHLFFFSLSVRAKPWYRRSGSESVKSFRLCSVIFAKDFSNFSPCTGCQAWICRSFCNFTLYCITNATQPWSPIWNLTFPSGDPQSWQEGQQKEESLSWLKCQARAKGADYEFAFDKIRDNW